jgi:hypothetical protein
VSASIATQLPNATENPVSCVFITDVRAWDGYDRVSRPTFFEYNRHDVTVTDPDAIHPDEAAA